MHAAHITDIEKGVLPDDLQRCHDLLGLETWHRLAGQRIFITGGTGFIGKWMLATLLDANQRLQLGCQVSVLSRDPANFQRTMPELAAQVRWFTGDVRDFPIPDERFDILIHAATDVVAESSPDTTFSTCLDGTRQVLALARQCGAAELLLISSGAVYGNLPNGMTHVPETHLGGPDPLLSSSAYGEGKRVSEWLASMAADDQLRIKIARVFALVGPHQPLDKHFAIGNFLRAALEGKEIVIQGDGTPYRSYLYAADMAAWLWAVLLRGTTRKAYNVGSEESLSIAELAQRVCQVMNIKPRIRMLKSVQPNVAPQHYVPDTTRARFELQLPPALPLNEAIYRTARWHTRSSAMQGRQNPGR